MNVLIAGGGTGGHLFPAIAVAEEFSSICPSAKITFVGTSKGLESRIIPLTMWELITMSVPSFKGTGLLGKLKTLLFMPYSIIQSFLILRRTRPSLVMSVGGYAAGPVTLVASLIGIPTVALEQNAIPGVTNRILGRFVKKVFVMFAGSAPYFPKGKVVVSGNPVRRKIRDASSRKPVKRKGFTLLVFGGSQGARTINENMASALEYLEDLKDDLNIVHQIGRNDDIERFKAVYRSKGFKAEVYHFIEDMGKFYSQADLVVCRAGATSVAELSVAAKPAIFIPYPYAADNHQEANARALVDAGGAVMIRDRELTGELLASEIKRLIDDPLRLAAMSEGMRRFGRPDAAGEIVRASMELFKKEWPS